MFQQLKQKFQGKIEFFSIKQKLNLGFGSLLVFMVVIILVNLVSLFVIRANTNEIIEEHEPTVFAAIALEGALKNASSSLGFYLLSHDEKDKANYIASTNKIDDLLKNLLDEGTIQDNDEAYVYLLRVQENIAKFKTYQATMLELATSPAKNFPGIDQSTAIINPISQQILQYLYLMIYTLL